MSEYERIRREIREGVEVLDRQRGLGELSVMGCLVKCNKAIEARNTMAST